MNPQRFARLKRLILRAKDLSEDERQTFLEESCEGDPELRREVEALLAHHDTPDEMMRTGAAISPDTPGAFAGLQDLATLPPELSSGRYQDLRRCGEGGMAVVYVAEDTKLQRAVALKFLRPDFAGGEEAKDRFVHEARAAAALDHPNICTIYEVEDFEDLTFISMAFVEGVTLRERISAGPLPIEDAVQIAAQLASGLREAHAKGVVHRDIKPSNLMITTSGLLKIMDFGIARFARRSDGASTELPAGTVGYMSPEQAGGQSIDQRTDIWALGIVLYEMLAGEPPFTKEVGSEVDYDLVQEKASRIATLRRALPPGLDALVQRCLKTDPGQRPEADEVVRLLDSLHRPLRNTEALGVPAEIRRRRSRAQIAVALALFIVLATVGSWRIGRRGTQSLPAERDVRRLTAFQQEQLFLGGSALSPDGRYLAVPHQRVLDVVSVETGATRRVTPAYESWITRVAWGVEGRTILCYGRPRLWFQSIDTDSSRLVFEGAIDLFALSPDGARIALVQNAHTLLSIMDSEGGKPTVVQRAAPGELLFSPTWSPSGKRIAYLRASRDENGERVESIESCDLEGRRVAVIEDDCCLDDGDFWSSLCWLADGRLIFARFTDVSRQTSQLQSIEVDADSGQPMGGSEPLLALEEVRLRQPSASADGHRLSFHREKIAEELLSLRLDAAGNSVGVEPMSSQRWPGKVGTWTRDGQRLFFAVVNLNGDRDIAEWQLVTGAERPFVKTPKAEEPLCLSPDGSELIFRQDDAFLRVPVNGGSAVTVLEGDLEDRVMCAAMPGSLCVLSSVERSKQHTELVVRRLDLETGAIGDELGRTIVEAELPIGFEYDLSPDATRIAIVEHSGRLRILDLRNGSEHELRSDPGRLQYVSWSGDAKWLCVAGMGGETRYWLKRVPLDGDTAKLLWTSTDHWVYAPRPSPDGTHIAFGKRGWETDVWLLEEP